MSAEQNKRIIQQYFNDLRGKPKTRALMDKYISDRDEELKQHIEVFEAAFPGYDLEAKEIVAEDDKVFISFNFKGTHQGAFNGIPPTRKTVHIPGSIVDTLLLLQQLGVVPEMAG